MLSIRPAARADLPLIADWPNRPLQKVDHEHGKPALTHWQVLAHEPLPPMPGISKVTWPTYDRCPAGAPWASGRRASGSRGVRGAGQHGFAGGVC